MSNNITLDSINEKIESIIPPLKRIGIELNQLMKDLIQEAILSGAPFFTLPSSKKYHGMDMDIYLKMVNMRQLGTLVPWSYSARLNSGDPSKDGFHRFYIYGDNMLHLDKTLNLILGRAVNADMKEESKINNVWLKIDAPYKDSLGYHRVNEYDNFSFDARKLLQQNGILNSDDPNTLNRMMETLKKGDILEAGRLVGKQVEPILITADPEHKKLVIMPKSGKTLQLMNAGSLSVNLGIPNNKTGRNNLLDADDIANKGNDQVKHNHRR